MGALRRFILLATALPAMMYSWSLYDDFLRYRFEK